MTNNIRTKVSVLFFVYYILSTALFGVFRSWNKDKCRKGLLSSLTSEIEEEEQEATTKEKRPKSWVTNIINRRWRTLEGIVFSNEDSFSLLMESPQQHAAGTNIYACSSHLCRVRNDGRKQCLADRSHSDQQFCTIDGYNTLTNYNFSHYNFKTTVHHLNFSLSFSWNSTI